MYNVWLIKGRQHIATSLQPWQSSFHFSCGSPVHFPEETASASCRTSHSTAVPHAQHSFGVGVFSLHTLRATGGKASCLEDWKSLEPGVLISIGAEKLPLAHYQLSHVLHVSLDPTGLIWLAAWVMSWAL